MNEHEFSTSADDDKARSSWDEALGQSEAFLAFNQRLSQVAKVDRAVFLIGERGTGKELAARRLHYLSNRWKEPFVALNCAGLVPTLVESELFGHEAGAFTGATRRRSGRFEAANRGTLFLDEIANIPMEVQEKILRVVEYGTFERVGGSDAVHVDARIIGATNVDLLVLASEGRFKQDLLDRLSFEVLHLPPLRERRGDILLLANHFAARMAHELGREGVPEFSEEAMEDLEAYRWPGNIRELKNVVERAVFRADSSLVSEIVFDPFRPIYRDMQTKPEPASEEPETPEKEPEIDEEESNLSLREAVQALEIRCLNRALRQAKYNQRKAAEILGLTYHQFRGLYRKYRREVEEG